MHYRMEIRWSSRCRDKSAVFNPAPRYAPQTFGYQFYHLSSITEVLLQPVMADAPEVQGHCESAA
jgi:hypothetical protein